MLSRLLRRLQGHPSAPMPRAAPRAVVSSPDVDPPSRPAPDVPRDAADGALQRAFVRHLLDAVPGTTPAPDLCSDVLERLGALSRHLDVGRLPRLPAMVPQLLAALRRDDVSASGLAALLSRDPTLAGDVVRVANSAHYGRSSPATTLPQAIGTIGLEGLRYVVLTTVMRPILQSDPSQQAARTGERLARHGEARTWLCGRLAPGQWDPGEAQLSSVVAATGLAALMRMLPRSLLAQAAADAAFAPAFLALAGELSARAAAHWRLDASMCDALSGFNDPGADAVPLVRILARADRLAMLHALRSDEALSDEDAERLPVADTALLAEVAAATAAAA